MRSVAALLVACSHAPPPTPPSGHAAPPPGGDKYGTIYNSPTVSLGQPEVGDADKPVIRRFIKRNIAAVETCYEQAVANHPGLTGTVHASFVIAPDGTVSSSTATGLDPTAASCIAAAIQHIQFPTPSGGGSITVNYPFIFDGVPP
jgi:hypothetical protein